MSGYVYPQEFRVLKRWAYHFERRINMPERLQADCPDHHDASFKALLIDEPWGLQRTRVISLEMKEGRGLRCGLSPEVSSRASTAPPIS
jgi:hypothetical protein